MPCEKAVRVVVEACSGCQDIEEGKAQGCEKAPLEKTGEKLVYSRGLYRYFVTDVMDEDIICSYGENEKKFILSDKFSCWDDGEYIGTVSPEVIAKLPKVT